MSKTKHNCISITITRWNGTSQLGNDTYVDIDLKDEKDVDSFINRLVGKNLVMFLTEDSSVETFSMGD